MKEKIGWQDIMAWNYAIAQRLPFLDYTYNPIALSLGKMACRVAALLAMTSARIRHCERPVPPKLWKSVGGSAAPLRSASYEGQAIHLTRVKQNRERGAYA
jgi:hypothetical protein